MNRYSLEDNILEFGSMVVWLRENAGKEQKWSGKVLEPVHLKKSYKWAIGEHRVNPVDPDSFTWLCIWIPDGPVHTAFVLRWGR